MSGSRGKRLLSSFTVKYQFVWSTPKIKMTLCQTLEAPSPSNTSPPSILLKTLQLLPISTACSQHARMRYAWHSYAYIYVCTHTFMCLKARGKLSKYPQAWAPALLSRSTPGSARMTALSSHQHCWGCKVLTHLGTYLLPSKGLSVSFL